MAHYTLLLLEATGIQDYIFGSNELAQNIGAGDNGYTGITADRLSAQHAGNTESDRVPCGGGWTVMFLPTPDGPMMVPMAMY